MQDVPDAPWIRDAERNGVPECDAVRCPICGMECDTIYLIDGVTPVGCENCIETKDAYEWADENREE